MNIEALLRLQIGHPNSQQDHGSRYTHRPIMQRQDRHINLGVFLHLARPIQEAQKRWRRRTINGRRDMG